MARTKISEFSATPGNNTDIDGINIAEGCAPSGINDAIRELMSQLKDFQAGTAGDSFNGPVGTTTAAAGAFTTLSASSTVSGTGFSNYLASPPAIGGTAAAAGSFTTLSASSTVTLSGGTANGVLYLNGSKVATSGSALTFDGTNFATTGNVTAGTTSVGANIVAYASSYGANGLIRVFGTDGLNKGAFNASSATTVTLNARSGVSIIFEANDTEQMRLTSTGLGIGTTSFTARLTSKASANTYTGGALALVAAVSGTSYLTNSGGALYVSNDGSTDHLILSSSGNLGLGVTPSAWSNYGPAFQIGYSGLKASYFSTTNNQITLLSNAYEKQDTSYAYILGTNKASAYKQIEGAHQWLTAGTSGGANTAVTFTQAMTLDASGQLAIGRTSASATLDIEASGGASTYWRRTGYSNRGTINVDGTNATLASEGALLFGTGSGFTERARIDSSGNLLVNYTGSAFTGKIVGYQATAGSDVISVWNGGTSGTRNLISFFSSAGATGVGSITTDGANTAYNTSSDYRLKDNPQPLTGSGAFIDALQPKTWNWKADGSKGVGFIAHEVQEVSPSSVVGEKDGEQMQAMEYGSAEFIANIIAELQSLRKRVAQLEKGN